MVTEKSKTLFAYFYNKLFQLRKKDLHKPQVY